MRAGRQQGLKNNDIDEFRAGNVTLAPWIPSTLIVVKRQCQNAKEDLAAVCTINIALGGVALHHCAMWKARKKKLNIKLIRKRHHVGAFICKVCMTGLVCRAQCIITQSPSNQDAR